MFFQFVLGFSIWIVGAIVYAIQGFPVFQPIAMLGGFFWSTGNLFTVKICDSDFMFGLPTPALHVQLILYDHSLHTGANYQVYWIKSWAARLVCVHYQEQP